MTNIIETMARALWIAQAVGIDDPALAWDSPEKTEHPLYWSQRMDDNRPAYIAAAQAALTAITEAGMVIVPREPTEAMLEAANLADRGMTPWGAQYRAMINAAQAPHIMPPPMRDSGPLESEEGE